MRHALTRRRISNRALAWLLVAALLAGLMPLYALSFFNHAYYDDFGYTIRTHAVWQSTGSFLATLSEAVQNTLDTRQTWEGNYTSTFLNSIQPALFGEGNYWLTSVVLISFFLFALWYFLRQVLLVGLKADQTTFRMAFAAVAFVMIQFVPDLSEAFFWYAGGMAYTLLWSMMLLRVALWFKLDRAGSHAGAAVLYVLVLAATVAVGGSKFSTVLFAALLDGLLLLYSFAKKRPRRFLLLSLTLVLLLCFAFCVTSPGNQIRAATLNSTVSAPMAVLQAFYFGLALMGSWFSLPLLVVWAMVGWQLVGALRGSPLHYNHPIWITILCVCLFSAQLAPTLYTGNYLGDGRSLNSYFFTFVLMGAALCLYWTGWLIRRLEARTAFPAIGAAKKDGLRIGAFLAAAVLVVVGCISFRPNDGVPRGVQNLASVSALRSLLSGEAAAFDRAMDERDAALNDPGQPEVVLTPIQTIPDAFMGDPLTGDSVDYVLHLYAEYYQKQRVSVEAEEE